MDESAQLGLMITAGVAAGILIAVGVSLRAKSPMNPVLVVLLGGGLTWLYYLAASALNSDIRFLQTLQITKTTGLSWVRFGLVWLLIYQALKAFPPNTAKRKVIFFGLVIILSNVADEILYKLQTFVYNPYRFPIPWILSMEEMGRILSEYPSLLRESGYAVMVIWLSSKWLRGGGETEVHRTGGLGAVGLGGLVMAKDTDQTTRYLCASALLGQNGARELLIKWFHDNNRAVPPEIGIDLKLAMQVARYAEKRDRRYWWIYLAIAVASMTLAIVNPWLAVVGGLLAAGVFAQKTMHERNEFAPLFWPGRFESEEIAKLFPAELDAKDLSALPRAGQDFFVYGGFVPFVGSGYDLGGWSVAIALDKPKQDLGYKKPIQPVEIADLYKAIDVGLDRLNLPSMEKRDCFFANGVDVRGNTALLPDIFGRPVQSLEPEIAQSYMYRDDAKVRHYRCYRIVDWGGELALSYYLRCSRRGNSLFVETKRFILVPIAAGYRGVDRIVPMDLMERFWVVVAALIAGPLMAVVSPFVALAAVSRWWTELWHAEDKKRRELIEKNPMFNYGTQQSFRMAVSSGEYGHYFQKIDGDFYNKLFEREVLDSLIGFLDERGIDTSELKDRQTTILNSGVIVQGGDVKAESLAVGVGAQAVKSVAKKALGGKAAAKGAGE